MHKMRVARPCSSYENSRGLVSREREVRRISRLCIESALREYARTSIVCVAVISKVPFTRDDQCKSIIAVGMRRDSSMRRYLELDGIRACLDRIAG